MREGKFSRTAAFVALLRALGDRGLTSAAEFHDPTAAALLPARWSRAFTWLVSRMETFSPLARARIIERVDLLVVRTLAIDSEVAAAIDRGCRQVVILGAGFDGRAHRMSALEGVHVFEVDHPATQAIKREKAANLARSCGELTYVSCDFVRDRLADCLQSAGHRPLAPTAWIWEGVTLYLKDDALRATLDTVAERSAESSALIVEYHDRDAPTLDRGYSAAREILLALWSERQIGLRTQRQMRVELERVRLRIERDFAVGEWGATHAGAKPTRMRRARLAVVTPG